MEKKMSSNYVLIDLAVVVEALGDHYRATERDAYTAPCPECGEQVSQEANRCPCCQAPVVWLNSKRWKALYGRPQDAIKRLEVVEPATESGRKLCRVAGQPGFGNRSEAERWASAASAIGEARASGIVDYAVRVMHKRPRWNGRGLIVLALNVIEKAARESDAEPAPPPELTDLLL